MPGHSGPNTLGESNLVFAYDTGDVSNSYIGQPTTNVEASNIDTTFESLSDDDAAGFNNQLGSGNYLGVTSTIGYRSSKSLRINRGTGGSGRIYKTYSVSTGEYSTVSAWVYSTVVGPYLTLEYNGGDYSWGVAYTNNTHTGKGWERLFVRTNGSATSNTTAYYFLYTSVENTDIFLDNIQTEKKQYPTTFVNGTRSVTQGLLPLIGNSTINLTNASFNSNAQIVFDGTNDYINIGVGTGINQFSGDFTVSLWAMRTAGGNYGNLIGDYYTNSTVTTGEWQIMMGPSSELNLYKVGPGYIISNVASGFSNNTWINVVVTRSGNLVTMYANSNAIATGTDSTSYGTVTGNLNIGIDGNNSSEPFPGKIDKVEIYNRALTAQEVRQNYQQYKTRFNLS